jgi:hypothetical protein
MIMLLKESTALSTSTLKSAKNNLQESKTWRKKLKYEPATAATAGSTPANARASSAPQI